MITKEKLLPALLTINGEDRQRKVRAQTEPVRKGYSQTGLVMFELRVGGICLNFQPIEELEFLFEFEDGVTLRVRGTLKSHGLNDYVIETVGGFKDN